MRRTLDFHIRISPDERKQMKAMANAEGYASIAELMRAKTLGPDVAREEQPPTKSEAKIREEWITKRATQLYGAGITGPAATAQAQAEWSQRHQDTEEKP